MLVTPKTLPKSTLITNLPGTKPVKVEYLSTTNVFAMPNATATVMVSDDLHGHRFVGATLMVLEIDAPDHVTMLWHCDPENHTAVPVGTA
jgi:hypothetical protein